MELFKEIVLRQDLRDLRSGSNNVSYLCSLITYVFSSSSTDFRERNSFFRTQGAYERTLEILKPSNVFGKKKENSEICYQSLLSV